MTESARERFYPVEQGKANIGKHELAQLIKEIGRKSDLKLSCGRRRHVEDSMSYTLLIRVAESHRVPGRRGHASSIGRTQSCSRILREPGASFVKEDIRACRNQVLSIAFAVLCPAFLTAAVQVRTDIEFRKSPVNR